VLPVPNDIAELEQSIAIRLIAGVLKFLLLHVVANEKGWPVGHPHVEPRTMVSYG